MLMISIAIQEKILHTVNQFKSLYGVSMRKLVLVIVLIVLCSVFIFPKDNSLDIKDIPEDIKYCTIVGMTVFGAKVAISIDFGQKWSAAKSIKRDGKLFSFNSMVDALNWMEQNGWEFVDAYSISTGNGGVYHFLMKRAE
jgi:hypothetical protein